jgi:hypothetical protein
MYNYVNRPKVVKRRSTDTNKCVMLKFKLKNDTNTKGHV